MTQITSAPVIDYEISQIVIPETRQRAEAVADSALISSIEKIGLLNAIIIRENGELIAGERRLDAFRKLERTHIPVRIFEQLSPLEAHLVELMENLARKSLSWQEETQAVADYHTMRLEQFAGWTATATAEDIGYSPSYVQQRLAVAKFLADEEVAGATSFRGAYNLIEARAARKVAAAQARGLIAAGGVSDNLKSRPPIDATKSEKTDFILEGLSNSIDEAVTDAESILDKLAAGEAAEAALIANQVETTISGEDRIITTDFTSWATDYTGSKFDVIHCDFPYGKGYSGSRTRKTGKATHFPAYADEADIYFNLVADFLELQDNFVLPQAHCIFWCDMMHYSWTIEQFTTAGWRLVQPFPLLWTKGHQGVAADTKRRPRHCYETALFFSRGDRFIRKLVNDHFECMLDEKLHMSQKPIRMLRHFLTLVVDEHSEVLDPTCGSGTALVAAHQLGAKRIIGLELEPNNADVARFLLSQEITVATADIVSDANIV